MDLVFRPKRESPKAGSEKCGIEQGSSDKGTIESDKESSFFFQRIEISEVNDLIWK
jgi:hypothetical protein